MTVAALAGLEPRLRTLLPARLYAEAWSQPTSHTLEQVFDHMRTLRYILQDYVPGFVAHDPAHPGVVRSTRRTGALMFTDLAGFTSLMEAYAAEGQAGAATLLQLLNQYFAAMVEIISKSAGDLLEWTGDAMLVQFQAADLATAVERAVRAGLRMQRVMQQWALIDAPQAPLQLGMRIGVHAGHFLSADIGTPRRMEYVILGSMVQATKIAEGYGQVGRVCLTQAACDLLPAPFHTEAAAAAAHWLVIDDLDAQQLGEYDLQPPQRRMRGGVLLDRSVPALLESIEAALPLVEQLAAYLPDSLLRVLVERAAQRTLPAHFVEVPVIFMNLLGLTNLVDHDDQVQHTMVVAAFNHCFNLINAVVEAEDGVLKNITYDKQGSTILIYFGGFYAYADGAQRAARTALAIRELVSALPALRLGDSQHLIHCKLGIAYGAAFVAEIGEPRGRREFNMLGDVVNTAARIMAEAQLNQILVHEGFYRLIEAQFTCSYCATREVKGKTAALKLYELQHQSYESESSTLSVSE